MGNRFEPYGNPRLGLGSGFWTTVGTILVLYVLLVIILCAPLL